MTKSDFDLLRFWGLSIVILAGCDVNGSGIVGAEAVRPENLSERCSLYYDALERTRIVERQLVPDIITGCPGREQGAVITERAQRSYQLLAADTPFPPSVQQQGPEAKEIFRRLLLRGVPAEIAIDLVETEQFSRTVTEMSRS